MINPIKVDIDYWPIAFVLWLVFFWGTPDLLDAIISHLSGLSLQEVLSLQETLEQSP